MNNHRYRETDRTVGKLKNFTGLDLTREFFIEGEETLTEKRENVNRCLSFGGERN